MYKYDDSDDNDDEENAKAHNAQLDEWNKQSKQLKSSGSYVYVLTLEAWNHACPGGTDPKCVGVFDSKEAAVAKSVTVQMDYGRFDEAIKDMFGEEGDYEDNRKNPPDNGVLIQVGNEDVGEGDWCRLVIAKLPIDGLQESSKSSNKKRRAR